jgi:hypothetical protein
MRMLADIEFPLEPFNTMVRDGTIGDKIQSIVSELQPEAIYFTNRDGTRGATMIIDVPEASSIPRIAEPFFLVFNANVEFDIVMVPEDLAAAGLEELGKRWG